jgi:hypothetical protein
MNLGHLIYLGTMRDTYLDTYSDEIEAFASTQGVDVRIWDDRMIKDLISSNFGPSVLSAYNAVKPYAYKADLARLCILYVHGGLYSDLGIRFLNKITLNKDIIVFNDNALKKIFGHRHVIQNAIIYSIPKQSEILECILSLSEIYNNREYGSDPASIGGTVQMGKVFRIPTSRVGIGEMGKSFTTKEDLDSGQTTLEYIYNGVHVANFKDLKKRSTIKSNDLGKSSWGYAWGNRLVY